MHHPPCWPAIGAASLDGSIIQSAGSPHCFDSRGNRPSATGGPSPVVGKQVETPATLRPINRWRGKSPAQPMLLRQPFLSLKLVNQSVELHRVESRTHAKLAGSGAILRRSRPTRPATQSLPQQGIYDLIQRVAMTPPEFLDPVGDVFINGDRGAHHPMIYKVRSDVMGRRLPETTTKKSDPRRHTKDDKGTPRR